MGMRVVCLLVTCMLYWERLVQHVIKILSPRILYDSHTGSQKITFTLTFTVHSHDLDEREFCTNLTFMSHVFPITHTLFPLYNKALNLRCSNTYLS